jgi:hypothetical protein
MEHRLSLATRFGALGVLFALMAAVAFGTSANTASAAGPVASVFVATSGAAGCGGTFSATASVRDIQGLPAVGVPVTFTSNVGTLTSSTGITNTAGQASATFTSIGAAYTVGNVVAMAGGISGAGAVAVNCNPINPIYPVTPCGYVGCVAPIYNNCAPAPYSPIYGQIYRPCTYPLGYPYGVCSYNAPCNAPYVGGAPARINLAVSPAIATCGSTPVTVQANVTDAFGVAVANGTGVTFTSTIGSMANAATVGGNATATLTIPAGSAAGTAQIRVTSGVAAASTTVQVNCAPVVQQVVVVAQQPARPAQGNIVYVQPRQQPQQQPTIIRRAPAPAYVPPFAPPRTGDVGLLDAANLVLGDDAANQSLIDSSREADYGVLDASQYDWVVTPDDSDASVQLASDLNHEAYSVIDASQVDLVIVADDSAATTSMVADVLSNPTDYGN